MLIISDAGAWAKSQGYTLQSIHDNNYAVSFGERPLGALVRIAGGYRFVSECSTSQPDDNYEENVSESFVSHNFGLSDLLPLSGTNFKKDASEIVLPPTASGTGQSERISDCNYWLPFAAEHYFLSRNIRDYVLVPIPAIFSDLPNTNGDSLSLKQMLRFDPDVGMQMYKTFRGKPTFLEHCFPGNTPILTNAGYKRIDRIRVGDLVLTHTGGYKPVTELFDNGRKTVSRLMVQGMGNITATKNHPFWVVDKRQIFGKLRYDGSRDVQLKKDDYSTITPHFRAVGDLYAGDYLVTPISIGGPISVDPDFAFLTGVYTAEGSFEKHRRERVATILTLGHTEAELLEEVVACLENLGLEYSIYPRPRTSVTTVRIKGREFANRMHALVGEYSHKKHCKGDVRKWDAESLKNFLGGYISGDGSVGRGQRRVRCVTVSKTLAYDIQNVFAFLGVPSSITKSNSKGRTITSSKGTVYACRDSYCIGASAHVADLLNSYIVGKDAVEVLAGKGGRSKAFTRILLAGGYILSPILKVEHDVEEKHVYNFEVEDDHTYVAYNVVVHNCNKDITRAKGVILDAFLRPVPFNQKYYKIVLLLAYDRTKDSALANSILSKESNAYSVGFYYSSYRCSICGTHVGKGINVKPCSHTQLGRPTYQQGDGRIVYRQCENATGFECSAVNTPAFVSALGPHVYDPRSF